MLEDRTSRIALALSLALHVALLAPVWEGLPIHAGEPVPEAAREPLKFRFVDATDAPDEAPEEPTPNVSTVDRRAAQPDAPADRPRGEAFSAGRAVVPTTPRAPGRPESTGSTAAERADERPSEERPTAEGTRPAGAAADRLALPRDPIRLRPGRTVPSGSGARLPSPEVDQRLTRATAGSSFSLNTTAWEYGPYLERLKRAIEENIHPPVAFYYGMAGWATRVRFRIEPDGRLARLELLDHRGVPNLQYVSVDAVRGAADFEPLPTGFPEPYLEITGAFYYNVVPE